MMPGVWLSCRWNEDAALALDGIAGNLEQAKADVERGAAELFRVSGEGYAGWLLTEMRRSENGLLLWVHAYAGHGAAAAMADLENVARNAGCVAVCCQSEKPAAWRLFNRIGWAETARFFEKVI